MTAQHLPTRLPACNRTDFVGGTQVKSVMLIIVF